MPVWLAGHEWSGDTPGARLRQARVAKNRTIRDLAKVTGLNTVAIGNLEANRTKASLPNIRHFAEVLRVPVYFLGCFEYLPENTLGQRITKARLFHGLTKEDMARAIGVDPKTLRYWEQGLHVPSQRHLTVLEPYFAILNENKT